MRPTTLRGLLLAAVLTLTALVVHSGSTSRQASVLSTSTPVGVMSATPPVVVTADALRSHAADVAALEAEAASRAAAQQAAEEQAAEEQAAADQAAADQAAAEAAAARKAQRSTPPTTAPVVADADRGSPAPPEPVDYNTTGDVNGYPCGGDLPPCYVLARESGGNPTAKNAHSTASGLWQFLDSTWAGHGGYQRAMDAPPEVQNERAREVWNGGRGCSAWSAC